MKILAVDDDWLVLELINSILDKEEHEVCNAFCYDDAVTLFEKEDFDLVITDIIMPPGKDGTKLISYIKEKSPELPVLAMTAGLENAVEDYVNWSRIFADDSIGKPFNCEDFMGCVKNITKG